MELCLRPGGWLSALARLFAAEDPAPQSRAQALENDAEKLLDAYGDLLLRYAYSYLHNMADAEEVLQDTLVQFLKTAPDFASPEHEKAWLIVTASNLCKNAVQHWSRSKREEVEDWEAFLGATEPPEEESAVMTAVMQLPDPYRTVVYLFYFEGYSGMEIAGMLGKKESTVRSLLHRAKKRLSKVLGGEPYAKSGR